MPTDNHLLARIENLQRQVKLLAQAVKTLYRMVEERDKPVVRPVQRNPDGTDAHTAS